MTLYGVYLSCIPVDAHVGKALFAEAILGALRNKGKTVILVTHALHFLSQCDYVYMLENGRIEEHGDFQALLEQGKNFARLMKELGGQAKREEEEEASEEAIEMEKMYAAAVSGDSDINHMSSVVVIPTHKSTVKPLESHQRSHVVSSQCYSEG